MERGYRHTYSHTHTFPPTLFSAERGTHCTLADSIFKSVMVSFDNESAKGCLKIIFLSPITLASLSMGLGLAGVEDSLVLGPLLT